MRLQAQDPMTRAVRWKVEQAPLESGEHRSLRSDVAPVDPRRKAVRGLAEAALAQARAGDFDRARRTVGNAVLAFEEGSTDPVAGDAALAIGETLLLLGVPHYATSHFEAAVLLFERLGDVWGAARARDGVGRALLAFGDDSGAQIVAIARATIEELDRGR
jgi:hypothetical protein